MIELKTCLLLLVSAFIGLVFPLGDEKSFPDLLKLVKENIKASENYVIPPDNSKMLELSNSDVQDFGEFDFIIIGSGAAGSVMASRLSEISSWKILVLEAGNYPDDFTKIVGLSPYTFYSDYNWGYTSTSQIYACLGMHDRKCNLPRGKGFGGSTIINGVTYARGHPGDFDKWAEIVNDENWSYDRVLPYFKKSENAVFEPRDYDYHGVGGYLTVNVTNDVPGVTKFLIKAFEENCYKMEDSNGPREIGVFKEQLTIIGNERLNTAQAFLRPFLNRHNLNISLNSFVTKILINEQFKKAYGVKFVKNGTTYEARAKKEIILSAGVYNSPQILMLSGVGPKEHLRDLNISIIEDLPVGRNLKDHLMFLGILLRKATPMYAKNDLASFLKLYVNDLEPLVSAGKIIVFTNLDEDSEKRPEIELTFNVPTSTADEAQRTYLFNDEHKAAYKSNPKTDIWSPVILLHQKSHGTVTLKSTSPIDKPIINPNFLSNDEDVELLYKGIQELLKLNNTKTFRESGSEFVILDSPNCKSFKKISKKWWFCSIRQWITPIYHPMSTNKMGTNSINSVVDSRLRVHGLNNLRVVDASVFPDTTSGHTMAPTIMVGERAGDIIKEDYGMLTRSIVD